MCPMRALGHTKNQNTKAPSYLFPLEKQIPRSVRVDNFAALTSVFFRKSLFFRYTYGFVFASW
jgi:hypothetical protein